MAQVLQGFGDCSLAFHGPTEPAKKGLFGSLDMTFALTAACNLFARTVCLQLALVCGVNRLDCGLTCGACGNPTALMRSFLTISSPSRRTLVISAVVAFGVGPLAAGSAPLA